MNARNDDKASEDFLLFHGMTDRELVNVAAFLYGYFASRIKRERVHPPITSTIEDTFRLFLTLGDSALTKFVKSVLGEEIDDAKD